MTLRRFAFIFVVGLLLEGTVFALYYDDLLYLRRPVSEIVAGPRETFARYAHDALERPRITRGHLDTIAGVSRQLGMFDLEVLALEHRAQLDPSDRAVTLRLADALRRDGQFAKAERVYLLVLETPR